MNHFTEKLEAFFVPLSAKISTNRVLRAISGGFSAMLPVVMVGAIFTLLSSLNIAPYQTFITNTGLKTLFSVPADFTTNLISLYAVFLIGKAMAEQLGMDARDAEESAVITLMCFLILTPLGASQKAADGTMNVVTNALSVSYFGSAGLFTAMLLGILIPVLHNVFIRHNIQIRMPDSVPPMISKSFSALIPAIVIGFLAVIVKQLCTLTSYGSLTMLIYGILKAPLGALTASPVTYIILLLVCNLMWFFGIHGGMVAGSFRDAMYTEATLANLAAYGAGQKLPNILLTSAWLTIGNIGGSACAIGLMINLLLFSKSKRYKTLAKIAAPAEICGISEPLVFGVPMVLNPVLLIPMLVAPTVTFLLGYAAMATGIVPYMTGVSIPTGTPLLLSGFLAFGSWKGIVLQLVLIVVSTLIYYPFYNVVDAQAVAEEKKNKENNTEE